MKSKQIIAALILSALLVWAPFGTLLGQQTAKLVTAAPQQRLRFTVELNSLEPQQVTVSEGEFILQVDNTVYLGGITVSLDDASAKAVAAKSMPNRSVRYVQTVTLKPGRHRLYVAGKSQLEAIIDVRSKP